MNIEGLQSKMSTNQMEIKKETFHQKQVKGFEDIFENSSKIKDKDSKIHEMINNIEELKKILENDGLTVQNLSDYKEAVRSFLHYYTKNELQMESHFLRDRKGYNQKVSMIRSVDEKLNDLTENMLETHQGHLETLKRIGEIHGLVVNKFM